MSLERTLTVRVERISRQTPQEVEAAAFAWLARATLHGEAGNLASVTGARGPRVLGGIYPA